MSNGKSPSYQWYPKDYLSDLVVKCMVGELGLLQKACYRELLDVSWLEDGLPDDEAILKGLCHNPERWDEIWALIGQKFKLYPDGRLHNDRLEGERDKQMQRRAVASSAGKRGMKSRWGEKPKPKSSPPPANNQPETDAIKPSKVIDFFHAACPSLPKIRGVAGARQKTLSARIKQHPSPEFWQQYFLAVEVSDFLSGRNKKWKECTIDWLLNEANMNKVLEGKYKNGSRGVQEEMVSTGAGEPPGGNGY